MGIKMLHHASLVVVDLAQTNWNYGTVLGLAPALTSSTSSILTVI